MISEYYPNWDLTLKSSIYFTPYNLTTCEFPLPSLHLIDSRSPSFRYFHASVLATINFPIAAASINELYDCLVGIGWVDQVWVYV